MSSTVTKKQSPTNLVAVGKITRLHGFRGELVILSDSGKESSLKYLKSLWLGNDPASAEPHVLEEASWMPKGWKSSFAEIKDEETAKKFKGATVYAAREDLEPTESNEYYLSDLTAASLIDGSTGEAVGAFVGIDNPAQGSDRWWFQVEGRTIAVPAQKRFIATVDVEKKRIVVNHLDELL